MGWKMAINTEAYWRERGWEEVKWLWTYIAVILVNADGCLMEVCNSQGSQGGESEEYR